MSCGDLIFEALASINVPSMLTVPTCNKPGSLAKSGIWAKAA